MADPRYYYQFTADAPPLAFPVSRGYAPIDYVPPTLPELELNQLLNGQPTGISPFGTQYTEPVYDLGYDYPYDYYGDYQGGEGETLLAAAGAPAGAYAAYRAGQAIRGMYDDAVAANAYASQGAARPRPGSGYQAGDWYKWITPPKAQEYLHGTTPQSAVVQQALPAGATRVALPAGAEQLALPNLRPTSNYDRVMYDLYNASLRERNSPNGAAYNRTYPGDVKSAYDPFTSARTKLINQGNMARVYGAPKDFMPLPEGFDERMAELDRIKFTTGLTPEQASEYNARWSMERARNQAWRDANKLTGEEEIAWIRNADDKMTKDATRDRKPAKETSVKSGSGYKRVMGRLEQLAKGLGSKVGGVSSVTSILSNLINPDPFDPIGNAIIRANPEEYPEQVRQYNDALNNVWY